MSPALPPLDMHAHIAVTTRASELERLGAVVFAATRSLSEFEQTMDRHDAVTVWGVGCHPGVLYPQEDFSRQRFRSLISKTAFVSEVGLDARSKVPRQRQREVFSDVLSELSLAPRILSIHSTGSSSAVLDALSAQPIKGAVLHWWRGSRDETRRAMDLGCWFSVNAANLKSPGDLLGIPIDRLLVETDHPSGDRSSPPPRQPGSLGDVEARLADLFGLGTAEAMRQRVWQNFVNLVDVTDVEGLLPGPVGKMIQAARNQRRL
jgi:TatD DNase family protein